MPTKHQRIQASAAQAESIDNVMILENNAEIIKQAMNDAILVALEEIGLVAERYAKENLTKNKSVDTGRLRNSVIHAIDNEEKAVYIGTNVEYAPYVELGTSRQKAKPYLVPAAQDHRDQYEGIIKKWLSK